MSQATQEEERQARPALEALPQALKLCRAQLSELAAGAIARAFRAEDRLQ